MRSPELVLNEYYFSTKMNYLGIIFLMIYHGRELSSVQEFSKMVSSAFLNVLEQSVGDYLGAWRGSRHTRINDLKKNPSQPFFSMIYGQLATPKDLSLFYFLDFVNVKKLKLTFLLIVIHPHLQNLTWRWCLSCLSKVDFIYWKLDEVPFDLLNVFFIKTDVKGYQASVYPNHASRRAL